MTVATVILLIHLRQRDLESLTSFQVSLPKPVIQIIREAYSDKNVLPPIPRHKIAIN